MECPRCSTDNPAQARFCLTCGEKLLEICPQCGQNLPAGAKFCLECGAKVAIRKTVPLGGSTALSEAIQRLIPKELAERLLATRGQVSTERRQVTILFCDVRGSTAIGESLDPEETLEIMNGAFEFLIAPIYRHEGTLARIMGDAILAFFGAPIAHEDDPERAIRAGLDITAEAAEYAEKIKKERDLEGFGVRVGINTGLVAVGELGADLRVEYTAVGDAINLAARMEQNAPVGGILITHDTYRHVRGVFDVLPQEPLLVKGKSRPVQTYIVERAKPRAFRLETRGVEGIETSTIGREAELHILQNAYFDAVEASETRIAVVTGDAGVGKSRLLYEFMNWAELRPEHYWLFKGRARAETQMMPYAVLRDLFSNRFEILESDSTATALSKFRAGMAGFLEPDRADLVGHWAGFDFSSSQAVSNLAGSSSFGQLASAYLLSYLRAMAADRPMVVVLEDMHWADDSSLDLIDHIVTQMPKSRLLFLCLARPALFERRPHWGEGREAYVPLTLRPLSTRQSRALVAEILQKAIAIPDELCELVVEGAEGNPFYVEELIKMLIEEGVIVRATVPLDAATASNPELEATAPRVLGEVGGGEEQWTVELPRLLGLHVPPTLTGVLQARLDSLPREAREVLQRASVVGRVFWDGAVAALGATETKGLAPGATLVGVVRLLNLVRERELVFRREHSSFAGTQEYIFKHVILHDVTYETVLLKVRKVYHAQVAQWLAVNAGERVGEYAGLIAEHYERAGQGKLAAQWLARVAEAAQRSGAFREAIAAAERGLALVPEGEKAARADLLRLAGYNHMNLGNYGMGRKKLDAGLALAREAGDGKTASLALNGLAWLAYQQGAFADMQAAANEALALAKAAGDQAAEAMALLRLGIADRDPAVKTRFYEESLALSRKIGDKPGIARCLTALGEVARSQGDYARAKHYYVESLAINREIGDRAGMTLSLFSLGEVAAAQKDHAAATAHHQEGLAIAREIGFRWIAAGCLGGLGHTAAATGDLQGARHYLQQALSEAANIGSPIVILYAVVGFARLEAQAGGPVRATEWLGLVLRHPEATGSADVQQRAEFLLAELRAGLPAGQLEAALAHGAKLNLDAVVQEILNEKERTT
jgi:predicted ATPase/class 3 adenylate cyclase